MKKYLHTITAIALFPVLVSFTSQAQTQIFSDNFTDGDDLGWQHVSAFAMSTGQAWDASSGTYRLTAPSGGVQGYGFVGSVVSGLTLGDSLVQSDVITWQGGGPSISAYGAFGLATRLNGLNTALALTGYTFSFEPYGNSSGPTIRLHRIGPPSTFNNLGSMNVNLTPGAQYTFTLQTSGSSIVGSIWNVGGVGTSLVGQVSATDATYASGSVGLVGVTMTGLPPVDTSWDNFIVVVPEPTTGLLIGMGLIAILSQRRRGC